MNSTAKSCLQAQAVDVLIVGGGIVGAAMALALKPLGLRVLLVDARPPLLNTQDPDARCLTLSYASIQILTHLGLWSVLREYTTPIEQIHVSERGAFGRAVLRGEPNRALGAVVPIARFQRALIEAIAPENYLHSTQVSAFDPATNTARMTTPAGDTEVSAGIVIAADGADSDLRAYCHLNAVYKDYGQHALVANVSLARAHQLCAYERFTATGLIALLPQSGLRAGLVWIATPEETARALASSDADFLNRLQHAFGYRLGRLIAVGRREVYPLRQIIMPQQVVDGVVFIGNAAHTIHPVAGQGFNLGLRDVAILAQCIAKHGASVHALSLYQDLRQRDQRAIIDLTDGLSRLYKSQRLAVRLARQLGLVLFDNSPAVKRVLARYASGLGGVVPDLVCGIPFAQIDF